MLWDQATPNFDIQALPVCGGLENVCDTNQHHARPRLTLALRPLELLQTCPAGTYSGGRAESCKPCGAGFYSQQGSSTCQAW